ncbi:small ubiquitin-related modifier 1-like [Salvia hispanica]|uniref:small ubiquitin-related modifier 1-like n=1 Tax=Salvia hispanica TaxID=49212 RepID=UPI002008F4AE|nr:small ubiquitin-related modifier 1-like [Salvia hispanica]
MHLLPLLKIFRNNRVKKMGESTTANPHRIAICIKSQDGAKMYFRVARDKKIQELLKSYCKAKNYEYREVSFIHNGDRIQPKQTLFQLGIEDGDEIAAMYHQSGGGNPAAFA